MTPGFRAKAKWLIHTVGPRYGQHQGEEPRLLAACYQNSLALARDHQINTIAFPAISTGIFGYPKIEADQIATSTCLSFLRENDYPKEVILISYV